MIPYKRLCFLLCCTPFIVGCWDNLELEERGFVTGIAIDFANSENLSPSKSDEQNSQTPGQNEQQPNSNEQKGQNQQETPLEKDERVHNHEQDEDKQMNENNKYKLTQQLINPSNLSSSESNKNSSSMSKAYRNLSQTGDTIIEMNRDMIKQAGRRTNVTHLDIVLFSEAVAQEEHLFADLMDIFLREKEMLRSVKIAITKNHASDYLDILPESEKIPSRYIEKVLQNKSNLDIAQPLTAGNVQSYLLSKKSFIIPIINQVNDTTINYEGLSVYSGVQNKVVGHLIGDEAKGINMIKTKNQTGTTNLKIDGHDVTFEILEIKSKTSFKPNNKNKFHFKIVIDVEAGIAEQYGSLDIMNEKNYVKLKTALEKDIKKITTNTISILQNDFKTDVIGLREHLYQHNYQLWESIKNDWEDGQLYFQKSTVDVNVNVTIEKPGNIIKSHEGE